MIRAAFATAYTPDAQARWPERELRTLAVLLKRRQWNDGWSQLVLAALDSHDALRERCLVAELERDQLRARVSGSPLEKEGRE